MADSDKPTTLPKGLTTITGPLGTGLVGLYLALSSAIAPIEEDVSKLREDRHQDQIERVSTREALNTIKASFAQLADEISSDRADAKERDEKIDALEDRVTLLETHKQLGQ